ncbi:hypothetical protein HYH03_015411 [Edaphochlamys debaryana]|uniref:Uncharacterized protein n=1 Tax=Edaphochlamys debaryana TaxID=47281 RepID=A0A835XN48_9CHLO|nr:hypothetical protein HYH03_015411 [Edaphochlamys debaryana]|eukprot:KAG2485828.1 hypothetical protein HYH03_015411 [Edaphochlamys debaryana]
MLSFTSTLGVQCTGPSAVTDWLTFDKECRALLRALEDGGAVVVQAPAREFRVGDEDSLHRQILQQIFWPLEQALSGSDGFFEDASASQVLGSARPDSVLQSHINQELLVAIEVKTSAVLCVPQDNSLPAMYYAAADSDSNVVKCVAQMYSYLDVVPYGVLVTDQQLICMLRESTVLLCGPSIPLAAGNVQCRPGSAAEPQAAACAAGAAREQLEAMGGGRSGDSEPLTAVAALYCMAKMSQQWWTRRPPPQQPAGGAGLAAAPTPALRLPTDAESECTRGQLFPGRSFDPRVPDGMPPHLGKACLGVVLQGAVGGRAAAVKLVDLWQGPEGKEALLHEVRMYQALRPLQGVYVPHLLGYGTCDGWQYFLATSLEGPTLDSHEGWAPDPDEEATCAAAFAALDAVHRCGVLHGDIALRNFVLAAQPAGGGGSGAGGGDDGGLGSQTSPTAQQPQLQPRVMLLDFGHSHLVAEAAEARGEDPAALIQRERRALQEVLQWEPPSPLPAPLPSVETDAGSGTQAAAASGAAGGDETGGQAQHPQPSMPDTDTDTARPGGAAAASRPGPPAAVRNGAGPLSAFPPPPPPPPRPPSGSSGWRPQVRSSRPQLPHMPRPLAWNGPNGGRSASRLSLRRIT